MPRPEPATSAGIVGPRVRSPRWIVAACGLLLAIVLLEVVTRLEGPRVCADTEGFLLAADDEVGWTFTPDLTFTFDPCAPLGAARRWTAPVSINAQGLHDQPWSYDKRPGEVRVLLLGDEVADGIGVARGDRLSVRIAHLSDQTRGARVSSINGLIPGYGPAEALRFLERRGLRYAPDVVVLLIDREHDLAATLDPPEAQALAADIPPASGLLDLSAAARWLAREPSPRPVHGVRIVEPHRLSGDADTARARSRLLELVGRMAQVSHEAGANFAVAIAPRCPLRPSDVDLCADVERVAPCVDLGPVFAEHEQATGGRNELCVPDQPRWGRDGHFLASHKIWDTLAARELWPPSVVRGHRL
jgi:hypothetical protein